MNEITRIAIDTSKSVFTPHGADAAGRAVLRRNLRRSEGVGFFEKQPAVEVVLEACGGSHSWGRALRGWATGGGRSRRNSSSAARTTGTMPRRSAGPRGSQASAACR
jgi:transposase